MRDPFKHHLRLKRPFANCPFLKKGAIELAPGRLEGITRDLVEDDHTPFQCHKTVHSARGGKLDEDGSYTASGHEAMCAGAAAYLMSPAPRTLMTGTKRRISSLTNRGLVASLGTLPRPW